MKYLIFILPIFFALLSAYYDNWWITVSYTVGVCSVALLIEYYEKDSK